MIKQQQKSSKKRNGKKAVKLDYGEWVTTITAQNIGEAVRLFAFT